MLPKVNETVLTRLVLQPFVSASHALPRMGNLLLRDREEERREEFDQGVNQES
jgi:hypothetical protein